MFRRRPIADFKAPFRAVDTILMSRTAVVSLCRCDSLPRPQLVNGIVLPL